MQSILDPLSYIRGPLASLTIGIFTLFQSAVVIAVAALTHSRRAMDFICIQLWARPVLWLAGVRLEVRGGENVSESKKGFLILFNHSSLMDIPILFCFPRTFRFGAKIELFKIPFFGKAMEVCGVLPIDRGDRNKVMKVYQNAIARVNRGESFALAPEGTRQKEPRIGSFKRGPFEFAMNAQMDIVPVVIVGAYEVLPKNSLWVNMGRWRRKVIMQILPKVPTAGLGPDDLESLQTRVREQMVEAFNRVRSAEAI